MSIIYKRIKKILKDKNLQQKTLAMYLEIEPSNLNRILKDQSLSVEMLERISSFLDVSPSIWWMNDELFNFEIPISKYYDPEREKMDRAMIFDFMTQISNLNFKITKLVGIIDRLSKK